MSEKKGITTKSDFADVVTNCYFVDKSLLIKELIDESNESDAMLITRPRRFGKSLNLDMIRTFFEKTKKDTSKYFKDLEIWKCGREYTSKQGKYPVIYLDFKSVMQGTYEDALGLIADVLSYEFSRHGELKRSLRVDRWHDLKAYRNIVAKRASADELAKSLGLLSRMLYAHHKVRPLILIDEYDVPIQTGADCGFYDEIYGFMKVLYSSGICSNECLSFAVLTGVSRVFAEGTFDGAEHCSVLGGGYSQYYGFTEKETAGFLDYFGLSDKADEARDWYGRYRFGASGDIFGPWGLSHYVDNGCKHEAFWTNTSGNSIIDEAYAIQSDAVRESLAVLTGGGTVTAGIAGVTPLSEKKDAEDIYTVLVDAGYLTSELDEEGKRVLKIPNKDVATAFGPAR